MSNTPRTEPYRGRWATYWHNGVTLFEHARTLELELAAVAEERNRLKNLVGELAEALRAMEVMSHHQEPPRKLDEALTRKMFVQVDRPRVCSVCESHVPPERVYRNGAEYLRCQCGHEKRISQATTITTNNATAWAKTNVTPDPEEY